MSDTQLKSEPGLTKTRTYITGLDEILEGGLPQSRMTLVTGNPGSGKTVLGLEFLYRGALAGEPGIFVGFEESPAAIRQNCATMGWDLATLEKENRLFLLESRLSPNAIISGEFSLKGLLAIVDGKAQEMNARRVVFDALEVALRLFDNPLLVRNEIQAFNDWIHASNLTAIMTMKPPSASKLVGTYSDFFDSLTDCSLCMDAQVVNQVSTHRLRVIKYRGSNFGHNEYPYIITENGLHAAPISTVGLQHQPLGEKISSGLETLDALLLGGYQRGACILFAGLPGTGKTILASTFAEAACARGEKVLYNSFEESQPALIGNVRSAGVNLEPAIEAGKLEFITAMPEAMGAEEHLIRFLRELDAFQPDHVVVDAISACPRMGGVQAAFEYLMRLLNACKERGVTTLLVNQTTGTKDFVEFSGNGISSMVDTVIFVDYIEIQGAANRAIEVFKARGTAHSNQTHTFIITNEGIAIQDTYQDRPHLKHQN